MTVRGKPFRKGRDPRRHRFTTEDCCIVITRYQPHPIRGERHENERFHAVVKGWQRLAPGGVP
jgi:hypothetical protein